MKKIIISLLLVGMLFGVLGGMNVGSDESMNMKTYEYTVRRGDTLNGIVYSQYSESSHYDVREVVWEIRNVYNDELDAILYVGQIINLPEEVK